MINFTSLQLEKLKQKLMGDPGTTSEREFASSLNFKQSIAHMVEVLKLNKQEQETLLALFQSIGEELDKVIYEEIRPKLERGEPGDLSIDALKGLAEKQRELIVKRVPEVLKGDKLNQFLKMFLENKISIPYVSGVQEIAAQDGFVDH